MSIWKTIQHLAYFAGGDFKLDYYNSLRKNIPLPNSKITILQNEKLKKLILHACATVPFYKNYFLEHNIKPDSIQDVSGLERLPVMDKQKIKQNFNDLLSTDYARETMIEVTSGGSTGEKGIILMSKYFKDMRIAAFFRNVSLAKWNYWEKSLWLWSSPYDLQSIYGCFKSRIYSKVTRRVLLDAYNYNLEDFPKWVSIINSYKPKILHCFASIIAEFAEWCMERNIRFSFMNAVISTAETVRKKDIIEQVFMCKLYNFYACREVGSIAFECEKGKMHVSDDTVIVEDINGCLVLTALDSYGFPLIRYKLGDTGRKIAAQCNCGCGFSLMDLDIGRETDNFIMPSGRKISGTALSLCISKLGLSLSEYQLIQTGLHEFEMIITGENNANCKNAQLLTKALEKYFGKIKVKFTEVKKISPEPSGKRLLFKCLLKEI
jgi:phenylacetate-CoA ligase